MRMVDSNCRLLIVLVALCVLWLAPDSGAWGAKTEVKSSKAQPQSEQWLMISLCRNGCSRGCKKLFRVVQQISGNPNGWIFHYSDVTLELIDSLNPEFIILGPQGTPWCRYLGKRGVALQNFLWSLPMIVEKMNVPVLGVCGGHQAMALAFGGRVGPLRAVQDDCLPYVRDRQAGMTTLTLSSPDPIFKGVHDSLQIVQSHYDEVKELPPGFLLLAKNRECPIQIMRHPERPVYGIQGHPENFGRRHPEGALLIRNFIEIARTHNKAMRRTIAPAAVVGGKETPKTTAKEGLF